MAVGDAPTAILSPLLGWNFLTRLWRSKNVEVAMRFSGTAASWVLGLALDRHGERHIHPIAAYKGFAVPDRPSP